MDFQDLTLDALVDFGALVNCISKTDYNKILQMSPKDIVEAVILQFDIGDWNFKETFIVAKRLTGPILGLTVLKNNSAILDVSQGLLHFPHLTYSIETDEYTRNRKLYKVQIKSHSPSYLRQRRQSPPTRKGHPPSTQPVSSTQPPTIAAVIPWW